MACYLCAYLRTDRPRTRSPLPAASPVAPDEPLGSCHKCNVLACSRHATRYSWFECAMCTPATAVAGALTGTGAGGPAAAQAHLVGSLGPGELVAAAGRAVDLLAEQGSRPGPVDARLAVRGAGAPNLVTNLAEAIRAAAPAARAERAAVAAPPTAPGVDYDAIGAAVRVQFAERHLRAADEFSATVVAGAMIMAWDLADASFAEQRAAGQQLAVRPPWELTDPALLDPVLWMVGTAVESGR